MTSIVSAMDRTLTTIGRTVTTMGSQGVLGNDVVLATCNVLHQKPYTKWAKDPNTKQSLPVFPWTTRVDDMIQALNLGAFADANVLCLQEFPYDDAKNPDTVRLHETFRTLGYGFVLTTRGDKMDPAIAYRLDTFRLLTSYERSYADYPDYGWVAATLQFLETGNVICVVSTHVKWGKTKACVDELGIWLSNSIRTPWIVAGDFNSDKDTMIVKALTGPFSYPIHPLFGSRAEVGTVTDAGTVKTENPLMTHRSGQDKHVRYDFILYKGMVQTEPVHVYPSSFDALLSHQTDQTKEPMPYFSDHAIVKGRFMSWTPSEHATKRQRMM